MPLTPAKRRGLVVAVAFVVGALVGGGVIATVQSSDDGGAPVPTRSTSTTTGVPATSPSTSTTPSTTTRPAPPPVPVLTELGVAEKLRFAVPTDCPIDMSNQKILPNAPREYRGGVHEGLDIVCNGLGHDARAAIGGTVLVADNTYEEPTPDERVAILDAAKALGDTPPWTLIMLYGRFVVIDSGQVPGVGHVVTIYAHLEDVDPAVRPGRVILAGTRLGQVGNRGTESAGTGSEQAASYQLHLEVHVDDRFLGEGHTPADTVSIYKALFGR